MVGLAGRLFFNHVSQTNHRVTTARILPLIKGQDPAMGREDKDPEGGRGGRPGVINFLCLACPSPRPPGSGSLSFPWRELVDEEVCFQVFELPAVSLASREAPARQLPKT